MQPCEEFRGDITPLKARNNAEDVARGPDQTPPL